jgi:hypothetical protein
LRDAAAFAVADPAAASHSAAAEDNWLPPPPPPAAARSLGNLSSTLLSGGGRSSSSGGAQAAASALSAGLARPPVELPAETRGRVSVTVSGPSSLERWCGYRGPLFDPNSDSSPAAAAARNASAWAPTPTGGAPPGGALLGQRGGGGGPALQPSTPPSRPGLMGGLATFGSPAGHNLPPPPPVRPANGSPTDSPGNPFSIGASAGDDAEAAAAAAAAASAARATAATATAAAAAESRPTPRDVLTFYLRFGDGATVRDTCPRPWPSPSKHPDRVRTLPVRCATWCEASPPCAGWTTAGPWLSACCTVRASGALV